MCSGHGVCHFRVFKGFRKKGGSMQKGPQAENVSESVVQTSARTAMVKSLPVTRETRVDAVMAESMKSHHLGLLGSVWAIFHSGNKALVIRMTSDARQKDRKTARCSRDAPCGKDGSGGCLQGGER